METAGKSHIASRARLLLKQLQEKGTLPAQYPYPVQAWKLGNDLEWVALRPELVVEIDFDHVSAGRIRHGAKLRRWRDDKPPTECTFDQLAG